MRPNPKPQEMYRHFKGNLYQIRCLAKHSETGETMVVYQAMYDSFQIYVRPLAMFMEEVDRAQYPNAAQRYRFELLQDPEALQEPETLQEPEVLQDPKEPVSPGPVTEPGEPDRKAPEEELPEERTAASPEEPLEQLNIDPLVMEFLDADSYEQRLNILAALRHRITDDMINTMAVAADLEIKDGDVEERYEELRNCLLTFEKYECNRLR